MGSPFLIKDELSNVSDALKTIRETCEEPNYRNVVSSTDKTSLDTQRTNINTALTNITNSQQTISSTKLSLNSAEGDLQKAQDQLALLKAEPQQADIDLYQAQIKQAQAQVSLLENHIKETTLKSPTEGQIAKINKKLGEIVQLTEAVISLISASPFQIKVDIYEEDVVKINVGNLVDITLTAFPNQTLKGKVVSIDPAEKLIGGVVYYEITIDPAPVLEEGEQQDKLQEIWGEVKPGMTADVLIRTISKENVLIIPEAAIEKKDGKTIVQVLIGKTPQEREIEIGLIGSDDMVEVLSGLKEGEEVVIK